MQLPAFRNDRRCEVVALAGSDGARTAKFAQTADITHTLGDWTSLVELTDVDAVDRETAKLTAGDRNARARTRQPVFAEKPLAADLAAAAAMVKHAAISPGPAMIDFNFPQIVAVRQGDARFGANWPAASCGGDLERRECRYACAGAKLEDKLH